MTRPSFGLFRVPPRTRARKAGHCGYPQQTDFAGGLVPADRLAAKSCSGPRSGWLIRYRVGAGGGKRAIRVFGRVLSMWTGAPSGARPWSGLTVRRLRGSEKAARMPSPVFSIEFSIGGGGAFHHEDSKK